MRALVVPVEGPVVPLDLPDEGSALDVLQAAVGGMIEALPLPYPEGDKATVYVAEDGKYTCLDDEGSVEVNHRATALMKPGIGPFPGDFIAGAILAGGMKRKPGRHVEGGHLLVKGLLRCGVCGDAMLPRKSYRGRPEVYVCRSKCERS